MTKITKWFPVAKWQRLSRHTPKEAIEDILQHLEKLVPDIRETMRSTNWSEDFEQRLIVSFSACLPKQLKTLWKFGYKKKLLQLRKLVTVEVDLHPF